MCASILFVGMAGAGKTQLIRTISDIRVLNTDEGAPAAALDVGAVRLHDGGHLRLYGASGQPRFRFTWDTVLDQADGIVVLVDHTRPDPFADMEQLLRTLQPRLRSQPKPVLVGVTHADLAPQRPMKGYRDVWRSLGSGSAPVFEVDAREREDVRTLLLTMAAMLEMAARFPGRAGLCHSAVW
jgi:signal recognition particle receptor subunit beta